MAVIKALAPTPPQGRLITTPSRSCSPKPGKRSTSRTCLALTIHKYLFDRGLAATAFLERRGIRYEVVEHEPTQSAAAEALAAGMPPAHVAKTVVLRDAEERAEVACRS